MRLLLVALVLLPLAQAAAPAQPPPDWESLAPMEATMWSDERGFVWATIALVEDRDPPFWPDWCQAYLSGVPVGSCQPPIRGNWVSLEDGTSVRPSWVFFATGPPGIMVLAGNGTAPMAAWNGTLDLATRMPDRAPPEAWPTADWERLVTFASTVLIVGLVVLMWRRGGR